MTVTGRRIGGLALSVALHAVLFATLVFLPPLRKNVIATEEQRTVAVAYIGNPAEPAPAEIVVQEPEIDGASTSPMQLRMPGFELDVARIRARQESLFPFLTEDLSLVDDVRAVAARRADRLTWFSPSRPAQSPSGMPPLTITDAQLAHLVDSAWSRRERWRNFVDIATLVAKHDPDDGRAYELLRTHLDWNLLQPYYDTTRDPRFWVMLNLASDHAPIIRFVDRFAREHPSSRSTTELLFLLDEFAQASRDAMVMLMATEPERDLQLTRSADASAYELAMSVRRYYREWLRGRGLDSAAIQAQYDRVRLQVLSTIIETTPDGYGAADARFLAGRIMWDQNKGQEAMRWWRAITPDARDLYAAVREDIGREMRAPSGSSAAAISSALGAEYRRWLEFSAQRLQQFGYTVDSF